MTTPEARCKVEVSLSKTRGSEGKKRGEGGLEVDLLRTARRIFLEKGMTNVEMSD